MDSINFLMMCVKSLYVEYRIYTQYVMQCVYSISLPLHYICKSLSSTLLCVVQLLHGPLTPCAKHLNVLAWVLLFVIDPLDFWGSSWFVQAENKNELSRNSSS